MIQKYILMENDFIILNDEIKLFRIKALIDFADVKAGDLGGYIESYGNLSQEGDCWVYYPAHVQHNGLILDQAKVKGFAIVKDNAVIKDNAVLFGAVVADNAVISGNSHLFLRMYVGGDLNINSTTDVIFMSTINHAELNHHDSLRCNQITLAKNYVAIYPHLSFAHCIFKGTSTEFRNINEVEQSTSYQQIVKILDAFGW